MGIFGPPLADSEKERRIWDERRKLGYSGRPPFRTRLLLRAPWVARVTWWHLAIVAALIGAGVVLAAKLAPGPEPLSPRVATVNGEPVTEQDIAIEAMAQNISASALDEGTKRRLLNQVTDRKLLVAAATKAGIIEQPAFQASVARMSEAMAANAMAQRFAGADRKLSNAEARTFVAAHPLQFGARQIIIADALATAASDNVAKQLLPAKSVDEMAAILTKSKVKFDRAEQRLDSAVLPIEVSKKLMMAPVGQMFVLPAGQKLIAGAVLRRIPNVHSVTEQLMEARVAAANERAKMRVDQSIIKLRKDANIQLIKTGS